MIQDTTNKTVASLIRTWPALRHCNFKTFLILNYHNSENLQTYWRLHVTVSAPRTNWNMQELTAQININTASRLCIKHRCKEQTNWVIWNWYAVFKQSTCNRINSLLCIGNSCIIRSHLLHFLILFINSSEFIRYKYN